MARRILRSELHQQTETLEMPMRRSRSTDSASVAASCNGEHQIPVERPSPLADDELPALDVEDPSYMLFLSHLRPGGNSYIFETLAGVSPSLRVKYEEDERSGDAEALAEVPQQLHQVSGSGRRGSDVASKAPKTDETSSTRRRRRRSFRPSAPVSSSTVGVGGSLIDPDYQKFSLVTSCHEKLQLPIERSSHPAEDELPALDVDDPEYNRFLSHLRPDGISYVFETHVGASALPLRVKYEEDERPGATEVPQQLPQASSSESRGSDEANKKRKTVETSNKRRRRVNFGSLAPISSSSVDAEDSLVDEDYQMFLNSIQAHDSLITLKCQNSVSVVYEKEEEKVHEQQVKNDVYPLEEALQPSGSQGLQEPEDSSYFAEILQRKPSLFRDKLMKLLREPFDQKKYECMMSDISIRKPIVKYKHLRDDSLPYSTEKLGKSYLDHYPDVARCIKSASDDHHKNFFLRGFFFWLKNLGASDAFQPWVPAIFESQYVSIESDGDGEEAEEKEDKETYKEKEGRGNDNIGVVVKKEMMLTQIKVKKDVMPTQTKLKKEVMPTESELCGIKIPQEDGSKTRWKKFQVSSLFWSKLMSVLEGHLTKWNMKEKRL